MTKVLVGLYEVPEKPANAIESHTSTSSTARQPRGLNARLCCPELDSSCRGWCLCFAAAVAASSFIKEYLGASVSADTEKLKSTIDSQAKLIEEKDREIQQLKKQVRTGNTQHTTSGRESGTLWALGARRKLAIRCRLIARARCCLRHFRTHRSSNHIAAPDRSLLSLPLPLSLPLARDEQAMEPQTTDDARRERDATGRSSLAAAGVCCALCVQLEAVSVGQQ